MFQFPTDLKHVKEASKKVLDEVQDLNLTDSELQNIKLCFEEAFINAVKYGNKYDAQLTVDVEIIKRPQSLEIAVSDYGEGFDFENCKDPTLEENLTRKGGRGIFLIKKFMDEVVFEQNGKRIRMIKNIVRK